MKSTIIRAASAVAVFTVVSAAPLAAQMASPIGFNVRAGAALPMAEFGDGFGTGFNVGAGLTFKPALLPVGLRFDGDYNRFGSKDFDDFNVTVWALTANAVLAPMLSPLYGIGGIGFYSMDLGGANAPDLDSETDIGFNVGAGFKLPLTGFNTFVEARYHHVRTKDDNVAGSVNTSFVPIVFGIEF